MLNQLKIQISGRIVLIFLLFVGCNLHGQSIIKSTYSSFFQVGTNDTVHVVGGQVVDNFTSSPQAYMGFLPTQYSILSINRINLKEILIYPNPFRSAVYFELSGIGSEEIVLINVITVDGKIALAKKANNSKVMLEMESFDSGIYIVEIYVNDVFISNHKLIKI